MKASLLSAVALTAMAMTGLAAGLTSTAQASVIYATTFSGNECGGAGGFPDCYATTTGTHQGADGGGSPTIYKLNADGSEDFGTFASVDGSEFNITFNSATHDLSFTYTPGANDPAIHYFVINQANYSALFYDLSDPITSFTAHLDDYLTKNPNGWSHITFFDTGAPPPTVPEPATLALFGAGLLGLGIMARRRKTA